MSTYGHTLSLHDARTVFEKIACHDRYSFIVTVCQGGGGSNMRELRYALWGKIRIWPLPNPFGGREGCGNFRVILQKGLESRRFYESIFPGGRGEKNLLKAEKISDFSTNGRSEEHTSELQSLMRISYAVFCLKKKKK